MSDIWPNMGDDHLHLAPHHVGFDNFGLHNFGLHNFAGALLGLRLAPLVVAPTTATVPADMVDCFAQIELFLHDPQAFRERLAPNYAFPNSLLSVLPILLRYRGNDLAARQKETLLSLLPDEVGTLCLLISDILDTQRSPSLQRQLLSSWASQLDAVSAQACSPHTDEIIGGISSAILYPGHYAIAITHAAHSGGIAPWLTGLIVGNWGGPAAIPLLLQLQIERAPAAKGLSRAHCQALAQQLFNQWAGCRMPNVAYG